MKKASPVFGLVIAFLVVSFLSVGAVSAQTTYAPWPEQTERSFVVLPFVNAHSGQLNDTSLLITNSGLSYDLWADFYVFNPNGNMVACCACFVKQNGLLNVSVDGLTSNGIGGPTNEGVITILSTTNGAAHYPIALAPGLQVYQRSSYNGAPSAITPVPNTPLGSFEFVGIERQCTNIYRQNGGGYGPGVCSCAGAGAL